VNQAIYIIFSNGNLCIRLVYKGLHKLRSMLPGVPFLALTATATTRYFTVFAWICNLIRFIGILIINFDFSFFLN
jgi:hypothetical protein